MTTTKRKLWQTLVALIFTAAAAHTGVALAAHDVPATTVTFAIIPTLVLGTVTTRWAGTPTTRTYTCPQPGCGISVTTTGQDPATERQMRTIATDHTGHTTPAPAGH